MTDKRIHPRFGPLVIKAQVEIEGQVREGYLTNVSLGGAFLAIAKPPEAGAELSLRALLPWRLGALSARARVVWRASGDESASGQARIEGVGIAFESLQDDSEAILKAYLGRFAELASKLEADTGP